MFKEEITQYCLMCQEWAEKYEALEKVAKTHLAETFEMQAEIDQLKQALQDIKEIAEENKVACDTCSERYTDNCKGYKDFNQDGDCTHCGVGARANLSKQILQKINEVNDEL